jgi:hypothetical protein
VILLLPVFAICDAIEFHRVSAHHDMPDMDASDCARPTLACFTRQSRGVGRELMLFAPVHRGQKADVFCPPVVMRRRSGTALYITHRLRPSQDRDSGELGFSDAPARLKALLREHSEQPPFLGVAFTEASLPNNMATEVFTKHNFDGHPVFL